MNRRQIQLGFVLILVALFTGLGLPLFTNPRLGLAAHLAGITGGLVLVVLGALAGSFKLRPGTLIVMTWSWVYAAYANWLACLVGAITGASRLTPIAGAGTVGSSMSEAVVSFLLVSLSVAAIVGTSLAAWGFRKVETLDAPRPVASDVLPSSL